MTEPDADALLAAHHSRLAALMAADTQALAKVVAEDMVFVGANGATMTRPEVVASLDAATMAIERMETLDTSIRLYGDIGILIYTADGRSRHGDSVTEAITRNTTIYARRGGRWMMVSQHQSVLESR